ncbi:proline-specific peptidase [Panus rudis PR-1116 ss-1]|nr:proline-specific peptidase [Panus rudis PR-1116 ss-1]
MTTNQPTKEGTCPFPYEGETYHTYFKIFGDLENRTRRPLIVLHGGPGLTHEAGLPLSDLAVTANIPVIFYDQLGNGRSSHIKDKPVEFWSISLFIEELVNLLSYLNVSNDFDLFGHSWGGVLGSEFIVQRQPAGLKHFIPSNSLASVALWMQSTMELIQPMGEDVKEGIKLGMSNLEKYWAALQVLHAEHGCRLKPMPQEYYDQMSSIFGPNGDPTVCSAPILKGWTIIDRLHLIKVPTFVINGRYDIAQDYVVKPFFEKIEKVKWVTFESSSHMPFLEERERFMKLVDEFLAI